MNLKFKVIVPVTIAFVLLFTYFTPIFAQTEPQAKEQPVDISTMESLPKLNESLQTIVGQLYFAKADIASNKVLATLPEATVLLAPIPTKAQSTAVGLSRGSSGPSIGLSAPNAVQVSCLDDVYKAAGAKYGIPWQILYGIHLTETGCRDGAIFNAAGSGARGPMQFMPGTWKAYEVDGNGDGVADIDNAVDAIYTAANYMAKHGTIEQGLISYGGNKVGVYQAAAARGYTP